MIDDYIIGVFALTGSFTNKYAMLPLNQALTSKMCNHSKTKNAKKDFHRTKEHDCFKSKNDKFSVLRVR